MTKMEAMRLAHAVATVVCNRAVVEEELEVIFENEVETPGAHTEAMVRDALYELVLRHRVQSYDRHNWDAEIHSISERGLT